MKADTFKVKKPRHQQEKIKKIAVAVAKNPKASEREIAEATGIPKSTVHDNIGHIGGLKEKWLEDLLSDDIEIVQLSTKELKRRLTDEEELKQIKATDVSSIAKDSAARYMAFRGDITDDKGGLRDMTDVSMKEIEERIKHLLG